MKRTAIVLTFAVALLTTVAFAASAQAGSLLSLGLVTHDGDSHGYAYAELELSPTWALGFDYHSDGVFNLTVWNGIDQGFFGGVTFVPDEDQVLEVGGWREMALSRTMGLSGWIAAQNKLGGTNLWLEAGAEVSLEVAESLYLFIGSELTLLKKDGGTQTWLGVGYSF